jgi:O-antigen/teichoic acid export membrane protein
VSEISRTENALKNIRITMICQIAKIISGFASRTVFTWLLGIQYLGIQGLFFNILSLLSFVELGMGSAVVFNLYEPLQKGDKKKICQYLQFYKRLYRLIVIVIATIGISLIPFLDELVKAPDIKENITVIYLLFLTQTCLSYVMVYKKSLLIADQKTYLTVVYQQVATISVNILQIFVLYFYTNYYMFLFLGLGTQVIENYICVRKANALYPFIKDTITERLPLKDIKKFKRNVKGLFLNKIAGVTFDSTDNIFISIFVGISSVGILSNYLLIVSTINTFLNQVVGSIVATLGNLVLEHDKEHEFQTFKNIYFANTIIYGMLACVLTNALGFFVTKIWLDDEFYLPLYIIWLIVFEWCLKGLHYPVFMFRSAYGFFYQLKLVPFWAAIGNLIMDYYFVKLWGLAGIYLATIFARMTVRSADVYVLFNKGFQKNASTYYCMHFLHIIIVVFVAVISSQLLVMFENSLAISVFITIFSPVVYFSVIYLGFRNRDEFSFIKNNVMDRIKKRII